MKLKLNKQAKDAIKNHKFLRVGSSYGMWDDLTSGGYFKPEDVLEDKEQINEVKEAIKLLKQLEEVYDQVVEEF